MLLCTSSDIYLFIKMAGMLTASFSQLTLPPSIFGFQMLKTKQSISTSGAGPSLLFDHRVCSKDEEIILFGIDVWKGNCAQNVDESLQRPHSLASQACLQFSLSKVFAMFLLPLSGRSSPRNSFGLWFWQYDISVSVICYLGGLLCHGISFLVSCNITMAWETL
jgi:hypothetical protein